MTAESEPVPSPRHWSSWLEPATMEWVLELEGLERLRSKNPCDIFDHAMEHLESGDTVDGLLTGVFYLNSTNPWDVGELVVDWQRVNTFLERGQQG